MSLPIFSWPPPAGQYVHCARYPVVHYAAEIRAQCTTGKHCALTSKFNLQIRILKIPFETIFLFDMIYLDSSEMRGLCLMKLSGEMLQNLPHFWNKKTQIVFFFHFVLRNEK